MRRKELGKETIFNGGQGWALGDEILPADLLQAENELAQLASVFSLTNIFDAPFPQSISEKELPSVTDVYRILVEQIPAVVFIAFFEKGFGETYVSPQIEATLGFTQEEWLRDPVRWYQQIHPEDKERWSIEAAEMFSTGEPLHSDYRVLARDGRVIHFHCEVKLVRQTDGRPWFIHGIGYDISSRHQNEEALRDYAERMKILSHRLIDVQESERRNIALELHDQIGQILTGLKLKLEMMERLPDDEVRGGLDEAQTLVNELITRTRELSLDLRPATLDHLGLLSAMLRHLRHYTSQTNVKVDFKHEGMEGKRFAPELETAAFRIMQEALTNVARHSGAKKVKVRIWADEQTLTVRIEDSGKGFEPEAVLAADRSNGLAGMRERAELLDGQFTIDSQPKKGTRLTAEWNLATIRK